MSGSDLPDRLAGALSDRYTLQRPLGEGGMATVYLAEDLKHRRPVAIKVLRPELVAVLGAERFLAEITTTANLQHPHILPLFDSGEADGFLFYVMPFIDGETLRDKLEREKQLGVAEAVRIAQDVAHALDYAHRAGIIHRDIKPGNVLLHDGRPVVADFGIALAVSAAGGGRMTETGLSLGTPHYMSPEQASADRDLSARSDVYSLGCVLYEMIAGQPPHTGPSAQSILVRILTDTAPPLTELRHTVPPNVAAAVAKAIEKLPADRFDSAKEFREALEDEAFTYTSAVRAATALGAGGAAVAGAAGSPALVRGLAAATVLLGGLAAWGWMRTPPPVEPDPPVRWELASEQGAIGGTAFPGTQLAVSPDGDAFVVMGIFGDEPGLFLRRSDDPELRRIHDTELARDPTYSPDGAWIAFRQGNAIRKVLVAGGQSLPVVASGRGPHWGTQETIVYRGDEGIYRVSSSGGAPTLLVHDSLFGSARGPRLLPDGSGVLFGTSNEDGLMIRVLDFATGEVRELIRGNRPYYVPTGHLVFFDPDGAAFAVAFDVGSKEAQGTPVPVLPPVSVVSGRPQFDVSRTGTLIYTEAPGGATGAASTRPIVWVDMDGEESELPIEVEGARDPRVSPDGRRIAYIEQLDLWIYDLITGTNVRVNTDDVRTEDPVWSPAGDYLYFTCESPETQDDDVCRRASDLSSDPELIYSAPGENDLVSMSPDGRWLVVRTESEERGEDLWLVGSEPGGEARAYLRADWREGQGTVSPNGRWMAYISNESGRQEVLVRSFPDPGEAVTVSDGGGLAPVWHPDGSALYYLMDAALVRVSVRTAGSFEVIDREPLFDWPYVSRNSHTPFDIHPDGDRILALRTSTGAGFGRVYVVTDWFEELRARMGEGGG